MTRLLRNAAIFWTVWFLAMHGLLSVASASHPSIGCHYWDNVGGDILDGAREQFDMDKPQTFKSGDRLVAVYTRDSDGYTQIVVIEGDLACTVLSGFRTGGDAR